MKNIHGENHGSRGYGGDIEGFVGLRRMLMDQEDMEEILQDLGGLRGIWVDFDIEGLGGIKKD